eukprot:m.446897 g.446897  ORF g.446897 m.446897 type:complete len:924 (+) comp56874_c0_seq1:183-2954(+)
MGCNGSKETKYVAENESGMGCIARGYALAQQGTAPRVSVMTGNIEVRPEDIDYEHVVPLGEGGFGIVLESKLLRFEGKEDFKKIVIKKLAETAEPALKREFIKEMQLMKEVDHPNLLKLIGVVTAEPPLQMIFEHLAHGNLKSFLISSRSSTSPVKVMFLNMCLSIAQGMTYLSDHQVIHRDLATRNCLVDDNMRVKIGDFGLSPLLFPSDYFQENPSKAPTPIRWIAPEVLSGKPYSAASDVWAFGVVIWEVFSYANLPYPSKSNSEISAHVRSGVNLENPKGCPVDLYGLMRTCFQSAPTERGTFHTLVSKLLPLATGSAEYGAYDELEPKPSDSPSPSRQTGPPATYESSDPAPQPYSMATETYSNPQDANPADYTIMQKSKSRQTFRSLQTFKDAPTPSDALAGTAREEILEIPRNEITVQSDLGKGAFGIVSKGLYKPPSGEALECALKTLRPGGNEDDKDALIAEGKLVAHYSHANVVHLIGQVTVGEPVMIVFEFMSNGALYNYLQKTDGLTLANKMSFAIDIATGMEYLSKLNHVHRDLATRNVLVSAALVCKISDFGLSRNLEDDTYYESEGGMIPIRWTPPEAYKYKKYSTESDVWSFGILLYEIWTRAALPYGASWTNLNVMMKVESGYRLPPPPDCPKAIYSVMMACWNPYRRGRPAFSSLNERLRLAHDMLFTASGAVMPAIDTNYGELESMYAGVPVPAEEEIDNPSTYLEPQRLTSPEPNSRQARANSVKPATPVYGSTAPASANAKSSPSSTQTNTLRSQTSSSSARPPSGSEDGEPKRRLTNVVQPVDHSDDPNHPDFGYVSSRPMELRKQRQVSQMISEDSSAVQDMSNVKSVSDVVKLSKEREKLSRIEQEGILKFAEKEKVATIEKPIYIESIGRATETTATTQISGRGACVCRRFKCVCGFK